MTPSEFKPMTLEELDSINLYCHCDDSRLCNQSKCRLLETCRMALKVVEAAEDLVRGNFDEAKSDCHLCGAFLTTCNKGCEMPTLAEALKPFRSGDSEGGTL